MDRRHLFLAMAAWTSGERLAQRILRIVAACRFAALGIAALTRAAFG